MSCRAAFLVALLHGLLLCTDGDPQPLIFGSFKLGGNQPKVLTVKSFQYTDCAGNGILRLSDLSVVISNDVLTSSGSLIVGEDISNLSVDLKLKYRGFITWPCTNGIGSCHYDDVCQMLNENSDSCESSMQQFNLKLPCSCPITKGTYTLQNMSMPIPNNLKPLITGKHSADIKGSMGGQQVLCYKIQIEIAN